MPATGHVLTSGGPLEFSITNAQEAFGGGIQTQLIGLTVCALAHEMDGVTAVRLFLEQLAPYLFGAQNTLVGILYSQLLDEFTPQRILNEGALRGLDDLFITTIRNLNLPVGATAHRVRAYNVERTEVRTTEIHTVAGVLRWIAGDVKEAYHTRTGLVARVAACLKAVGYLIGGIVAWNGTGDPPTLLGSRAVVLVFGGFSASDQLMANPDGPIGHAYILHYQYQTVGAMFLTAFQNQVSLYPEIFQDVFEKVYNHIETPHSHTRGYSKQTCMILGTPQRRLDSHLAQLV